MELRRLVINSYKNIAEADLDFSPGLNCFMGDNGAGKTNVLDSIHFLSMCRSMVSRQDLMCPRNVPDAEGREPWGFMLRGLYSCDNGEEEDVRCLYDLRKREKTLRHGEKTFKRLADHIGFAPVVSVAPSDERLVTGAGEERRRFMDMIISQTDPSYLSSLLGYNRALSQRNVLLRGDHEPSASELAPWEELMAAEGERISARRQEFVNWLTADCQELLALFSTMSSFGATYSSHCQQGPLLEVIREAQSRDRLAGFTTRGVHRDDILLTLDGHPLRDVGSQGQVKAALVAMKLALYAHLAERTGKKPILLLDDLFDKLDSRSVRLITSIVGGRGFGQVFVTDTSGSRLRELGGEFEGECRFFHVSGGEVSQVKDEGV